jgi:hypothetical protein
MDGYAEFTQAHAEVPWRSMRNMRNRMAHGYFDINLDVVWETVQEWLPALLKQLPAVRQDADDEDRNGTGWSRDQRLRRRAPHVDRLCARLDARPEP